MDTSEFSILIGRLERQSDDNPRVYAVKVGLVAALGYVGIALFAVAFLVACYFLLAPLLAGERPRLTAVLALLGAGVSLIAIVRALWVRIDAPAGRELLREEVPALFAAIDEIVQKMATRRKGRTYVIRIDSVTLNREFSASICQIPRWGVFGNYSNHLQLGVPLLAALSVAEFKTVLAHEIGHVGGAHGKFSAWIYRQRVTWQELRRKFAEPEGLFDQALAWFYDWYTPYFDAYTFVLARNHEYAADRAAARATNNRVLARALIKVDLMGRFLAEVFWKRLFDQVEKHAEPRYLPYSVMPRAFVMAQKDWSRQDWLSESLRTYASLNDTHPGLGERLAALDVTPELPTQAPEKSALLLLGENTTPLLRWCDEEWSAEYLPVWQKRHEIIREMRWKIAQYENTPVANLQVEDLWEKSALLLDVGQELDAIETLQLLVGRGEKFGKAHLLLGRLLLDNGNEHGLQNLTHAAIQDPALVEEAGHLGYDYLMDRGRKGEAQRFWDRIRA
ncbi:M48 family metallopeptidase [Povalibacter sp.]|uniref:M48 family metallopeptidase n=1 Tax=Povalibacter sp. TaxID=1962978 RepID=UPI002F41C23A